MGNDEFIALCKNAVAKKEGVPVDDVYVVWLCKALQNNKALMSTTKKGCPYYEFTHNGDKGEIYMDVYEKSENKVLQAKGE